MNHILSVDDAVILSNTLKEQEKSIVLVGGCFDILHPGHFIFLEKAKKQGDILFVLLESDQKITELKGSERPIHTQYERAMMLTALRCVDTVILLPYLTNNEQYDEIIQKLHPQVIATTEHDPARIHKERQAKTIHAKFLEVTPYIPHKSTSRLIQILSQEK